MIPLYNTLPAVLKYGRRCAELSFVAVFVLGFSLTVLRDVIVNCKAQLGLSHLTLDHLSVHIYV